MAGSRAPTGSLRKHADSVPKAGARKTGMFGPANPHIPKIKANTFTGDDSESESSSSSDSDSGSGSESDTKSEPISDMQKRISQTPKFKGDSKSAAIPAKSPTVNGLKKSVLKKSSKTATSSDSPGDESESEESDSGSDEDSKDEKRSAKSESSSDTSSASESEDDSESEDADNSEDAAEQIEEQIINEVKSAKSSSAAPKISEKLSKKSKTSNASVSEGENSNVDMMDQSMALTNGGSPTKVGTVPEVIAPDFHLRKLEGTSDASEIANFFSKAQLEGRQVWYITAPASLPVTVVQDLTIPMDEAKKGMPILAYNGEDYRMAFDNPATSSALRLLIPNKKGDEYSLLDRPVNQFMHVTRSETFIPGAPTSVTTTQTVTTAKPARPQPEGLRARYTPLGVSSPKPAITAPPPTKKAATSVAAASIAPEASSKKKRKHRDDGEDGPIATAVTPARKDIPSGKKNSTAEKSAKKQKTSNEADRASAPRRQTPVPLPNHINGVYKSGSIPPATQPAPRSRSSTSPGAALPATQVPAKQSPIPLPPIPRPASSDQLGSSKSSLTDVKQREQPAKKVKKEKKIKVEKNADSATKTPRKVSQILPPQYDKSGRRIS